MKYLNVSEFSKHLHMDQIDDDDEEDSFASPLDAAAVNDTIGSVFVCGAGGVGSSSCCSQAVVKMSQHPVLDD